MPKPPTDPELIRRARQLRRDMTAPERRLWYALRDHRLNGSKFRRQVVVGPYIVDFHNHSARLVIELDGDSHAERGAYDHDRQAWLKAQGFRVLRFSNDDVLNHIDGVLEAIILATGDGKS